ncbi:sensor domain-containing diguanylate cyclase [Photobacterium sp. ZSDE20]|uniref:diguanylate cyclase n=1 Tax=Photobacterium pectinilyticum TaxID=2906793 RepID=A0ABT1NC05_9GAMM|nr:sensor domain-containing diguanylate cyclase [Photobacterium sp. ZSDE20]MCQ1060864.1 sensor domain-containing diguanylate cyclase [Photobacterium sp. ZSDE20]MDD1828687.1 sensor domain-containing diguanylate cyclase [Photobacterium sp. ZSDE20]
MFDRAHFLTSNEHPVLDLEKWQKTVDLISQLFDCTCGAIVQLRDQEFFTVRTSQNNDNFLKPSDVWPCEMNSFCRHVIEEGDSVYVADPANHPTWSQIPFVKEGPIRSYFGMPIYWPDNTVFGTICAIDTKPSEYNGTLFQLLKQLKELITADLKLIDAYEHLKMQALTDELTGLYNRRGLSVLAHKIICKAHATNTNENESGLREHTESVAIAYFDSDNLKQINNQLGHNCGDIAIQTLAAEIRKLTRASDIVARVGGDEFIVLSPNINETDLRARCQQIEVNYQTTLANHEAFADYPNDFSVSYGCLSVQGNDCLDLNELYIQTDKRMYANKMSKRSN